MDPTPGRLAASVFRGAGAASGPAKGPLRVHPDNPRYFTDGAAGSDGRLKAVFLTGSHTWTNLIDRGPSDPPPAFEFERYLDLLQRHHHNFIRLWGRQLSWYREYGTRELRAGPLAWPRTGPGLALDGKPRFNLAKHDPAYFQRLRERAQGAGERGIYVSVMLFGGYQEAEAEWAGSPFHRDNNVNGIDGDPDQDGLGRETQSLAELPAAVAELQKAYVRKVIDTVGDLDNVLYEISNESGGYSVEWQNDLIRFIKSYEKTRPKQHPVGLTAVDLPLDRVRAELDASPADWVSYLFAAKPLAGLEAFDPRNPFVASGRKVSIQDSDHWWVKELYGDAEFGRDWVWKGFCRGHNPILMEHLPPVSFLDADYPLSSTDPGYSASREAMGQTRRYAERVNLAAMAPLPDLASTGYCLADPGQEYLVYLPAGGAVIVDLSAAAGELTAEWLNPVEGGTAAGTVPGGARRELRAPFSGPAVLYLVKRS
ncbi:MAG: DUF6298 domain-containing protein [Armatimonadota bacterium]